jgi:hypothetical protein
MYFCTFIKSKVKDLQKGVTFGLVTRHTLTVSLGTLLTLVIRVHAFDWFVYVTLGHVCCPRSSSKLTVTVRVNVCNC